LRKVGFEYYPHLGTWHKSRTWSRTWRHGS